jgi:hypothetical protein
MMNIQQHSSNPAEIEDPTSDKIREARSATFGTSWPHDGKRGWMCQSEKVMLFILMPPQFYTYHRSTPDGRWGMVFLSHRREQ